MTFKIDQIKSKPLNRLSAESEKKKEVNYAKTLTKI